MRGCGGAGAGGGEGLLLLLAFPTRQTSVRQNLGEKCNNVMNAGRQFSSISQNRLSFSTAAVQIKDLQSNTWEVGRHLYNL